MVWGPRLFLTHGGTIPDVLFTEGSKMVPHPDQWKEKERQ